jgi:hypothetical protein
MRRHNALSKPSVGGKWSRWGRSNTGHIGYKRKRVACLPWGILSRPRTTGRNAALRGSAFSRCAAWTGARSIFAGHLAGSIALGSQRGGTHGPNFGHRASQVPLSPSVRKCICCRHSCCNAGLSACDSFGWRMFSLTEAECGCRWWRECGLASQILKETRSGAVPLRQPTSRRLVGRDNRF